MIELPLQNLVREVDAQLLEAVCGHDLETFDGAKNEVRVADVGVGGVIIPVRDC